MNMKKVVYVLLLVSLLLPCFILPSMAYYGSFTGLNYIDYVVYTSDGYRIASDTVEIRSSGSFDMQTFSGSVESYFPSVYVVDGHKYNLFDVQFNNGYNNINMPVVDEDFSVSAGSWFNATVLDDDEFFHVQITSSSYGPLYHQYWSQWFALIVLSSSYGKNVSSDEINSFIVTAKLDGDLDLILGSISGIGDKLDEIKQEIISGNSTLEEVLQRLGILNSSLSDIKQQLQEGNLSLSQILQALASGNITLEDIKSAIATGNITLNSILKQLGSIDDELVKNNQLLEELLACFVASDEQLQDVADGKDKVDQAGKDMQDSAADATQKAEDAAGKIDEFDRTNQDTLEVVDSITSSFNFSGSDGFLADLNSSLAGYKAGFAWWGEFLGVALSWSPLAFMFNIVVALGLILLILGGSLNFTFRREQRKEIEKRNDQKAVRRAEIRENIRQSHENRSNMFDHYGY